MSEEIRMIEDADDLMGFAMVAKEAMKIERLVIQQKELTIKLDEKLKKTYQKEERAKEENAKLNSEIQFIAAKNKLLRDNLQGKRDQRKMLEQMCSDLEHQLLLQRNNVCNKSESFKCTTNKYSKMWEQYSNMYLEQEEAKYLKKIQADKSSVLNALKDLKHQKNKLDWDYKDKIMKFDELRNSLVIESVQYLTKLQKLKEKIRESQSSTQDLNEKVTKEKEEVAELEKMNLALPVQSTDIQSHEENESDQDTATKRIRTMLNFDTSSLRELKLPEDLTYDPNHYSDMVAQNALGFDSEEVLHDLEENVSYTGFNEENELYHTAQSEMDNTAETVEMETEESAPESVHLTTPESTYLSTQTTVDEPPVSVELSEPPETMELTEEQHQVDHIMVQQEETESEITEQNDLVEMSAEQMQREEVMSQGCSEGSEGQDAPYFTSAMSVSSHGSSLDLLDDEKRKAFMMKLMASPEMYIIDHEGRGQQSVDQTNVDETGYFNNLITTSRTYSELETAPQNAEDPNAAKMHTGFEGSKSFVTSSALFGLRDGQEQTTSNDNSAFNFGSFSFGASSNSNASNLFGGNNLFASSPPSQVENNPFAISSAPVSNEAFNLNFDKKTNTSSIFQLF